LPPQSVEPLAHALITLVEQPALRELFGTNGRQRFTEQFRHETMTRRIREVYQQVLDRQ
jgi:glycosyltransferase involved in cell wall biosynthesis